jgi:hypothetical protein
MDNSISFFSVLVNRLGLVSYDCYKNKFITVLGDFIPPAKVINGLTPKEISVLVSTDAPIDTDAQLSQYLLEKILEIVPKINTREELEERKLKERIEKEARARERQLEKELEKKKRVQKRKEEIQKKISAITLEGVDEESAQDRREFVESLIPIVLPFEKSKNDMAFYSPISREVHTDVNSRVYAAMKGLKLTELYSLSTPARVEFNPFSLSHSRVDSYNMLVLNTYNAPAWRLLEFKGIPSIPPFFTKLLDHLFPTEGHVEYVLAWICRAVLGRNNTILTLVGAKGIGKTLLANTIGALVGEKYYSVVGNSILTDKFNAPMKNNRLLFIDEVVAKTQEELSKLKNYVNNVIPIEEKGVDVSTTRNHNSLILSCNVDDNIGLQADDRRYSVPDLTDINLLTLIDEEEINAFSVEIENPESDTLVTLGNWILENAEEYMDKYPDHAPLKGESFYHIVRSNMKMWEIFTEDYILTSPDRRIPKKEVAKAYSRHHREGQESKVQYPKNSVNIENFLKSHSYLGKYRLARLEKGDPNLMENKNELYFVIDSYLFDEIISKSPTKAKDESEDL